MIERLQTMIDARPPARLPAAVAVGLALMHGSVAAHARQSVPAQGTAAQSGTVRQRTAAGLARKTSRSPPTWLRYRSVAAVNLTNTRRATNFGHDTLPRDVQINDRMLSPKAKLSF